MVVTAVADIPLTSVVIPVYRGGSFLREAVASVLAQSVEQLEVIVVSDGCPDDLSDVERMDRRVRVLQREHAGVSVARNAGVAASSGEYVAFLDEDDRSHPSRLQWQVQALLASPRAGMCDGKFRVVDEKGEVQGSPVGQKNDYRDMLGLHFPLLSTVTVRRSAFQDVGGFDPSLTTGEDIELFLRMAMQGPVAFVPEVVSDYRRHSSNTATGAWDVYPILQKHRRWAESAGRPDLVRAVDLGLRRNRRNAALAAYNGARAARKQGEVVAVLYQLCLSLWRDPGVIATAGWSHVSPSEAPRG
jgi:glycosyltransferase involved in cell wall biosynthesis